MPVPVARNRLLADGLVAAIAAIWTPTLPSAVSRSYLPDVYHRDEADQLAGRQVRVAMIGESQVDKIDRTTALREYRFLVLVLERAPAGEVLPAWVDERNDFVADLAEQLGNEGGAFLLGTAYPDRVDWLIPADADMLREHKLFWSAFEIAFREAL